MRSSLEIAQEATLRPIADVAEEAGIEPDELELYGRYKAKVDLSDPRAARRPPGREDRQRHRDHADAGRRGQDDDVRRAHAGARPARPQAGARAPRGVARARLRDQGRRGRRRLHAGRPDGGPEPPLHRRPARDHGRQQPARGVDRRPPAARQRAPASTRSPISWRRCMDMNDRALRDIVTALGGRVNGYPRQTGFDITAASEIMGLVAVARDLARPPRAARPHHHRADVRGRAGDGRGSSRPPAR